jgi:hypothetical protein
MERIAAEGVAEKRQRALGLGLDKSTVVRYRSRKSGVSPAAWRRGYVLTRGEAGVSRVSSADGGALSLNHSELTRDRRRALHIACISHPDGITTH